MNKKHPKTVGKTDRHSIKKSSVKRAHPLWVPKTAGAEDELCPECFRVVGDRNRYRLVRMLGKAPSGMTVGALTDRLALKQPTVTHHLAVLRSVDAVVVQPEGRKRVYRLNRAAHCFKECRIPY